MKDSHVPIAPRFGKNAKVAGDIFLHFFGNFDVNCQQMKKCVLVIRTDGPVNLVHIKTLPLYLYKKLNFWAIWFSLVTSFLFLWYTRSQCLRF